MSRGPIVNKFTSAGAILDVLALTKATGTVTVAGVRRTLKCCDRQARDYLAFLVERELLHVKKRGRVLQYRLVTSGKGGANELSKAVGTEFAVAAVRALEGTAFHDAALEHVITLRTDLVDAQAPRADRLRTAFYAVRGSVPATPKHAEHAETILDAIKLGKRVSGRYVRAGDGSATTVELRPVALVVQSGGLHLLGRKLDGTVHTYDVEGFTRVTRLKKESEPVDYDVEGSFEHAFGRHTDFPPQLVVLRVTGMTARQLQRRRFHPSQTIDEDHGESLTVHFKVGVCPEFKAWLLGMAGEVEVTVPAGLRDALRQHHAEAAQRHRAIGGDGGA